MRREPDPFDGPGAAAYFQMRLSEDVFWGGQLDSDAALTRAPQALAPGARPTAVSWTGGKDCNLALLMAWRDPTLRVTSLVVFRPQDAAFRAHPLELSEMQAASLGLPLRHVIIDGVDYKASYVAGMRRLRAEHGVEVIATGDVDLVGTMRRNWIEECGEEAGVAAFLPLWRADRGELLRRMLEEGLEIVFSCVKAPWFDATWIGRRLDDATLAAMEAVAATERGDGVLALDLGGIDSASHASTPSTRPVPRRRTRRVPHDGPRRAALRAPHPAREGPAGRARGPARAAGALVGDTITFTYP